jgi:2-polyprenyl-3-methyl-5-hydroxy-6-metoxy-1,4-benzoquinol methylase/glycosyltransferase involved in cell wall biosynthesis
MKLAYFSPLTRQRSGISDYSEELLPYLAEGAEVTLFVDGFQPANRELTSRFEVLDYRRQPAHLGRLSEFDVVLYHMGNDHRYHSGMLEAMKVRPGVLVFHDFALQDFFLGLARDKDDLRLYLDEVEFCYGPEARQQTADELARGMTPSIVNQPLDFPLNARIAKSAEGIIVHSAWQAERFGKLAPSTPLAQIKHHITGEAATTEPRAIERSAEAPVNIASFGLVTPDKGTERALRVLARLRGNHDFHYTLVGSAANFPELEQIVRRCEMQDYVTVTGHVSLDEFQQRIQETDIAICLRERSVGATSGSLCRIMAAGVAAIVSDVGAFSEFPNDAVVKIDHDEHADALLEAYLRKLIEDRSLRERIGANARAYVLREHRIEDSAHKYLGFLEHIIAERPRRAFVNGVADQISQLGVNSSDEGVLRSIATEVAAIAPAISPEFSREFRDPAVNSKKSSTNGNGRLRKLEGVDYKRAAIEYVAKLDAERRHYLSTKPFYNLANKPPKHAGEGMDAETFRHFCDFANIAVALALPPGSRILDVGCGSGWLSEYFARLGYIVHGIDISPELIEMARDRVTRVGYDVDHETKLQCTFAVHDIESAALDEQFDGVVCYDSLHHFEDERAVIRHLAAVTRYAGSLFILEGDRPAEGSATEAELLDVMHRYETLESPFSREYLSSLLDENGFAVVGDYVSVNGLFPRSLLQGDRVRVEPPEVNYLLCKKVLVEAGRAASTVPDSRRPGDLGVQFEMLGTVPNKIGPGDLLSFPVRIENTGDTLWLSETVSAGIVMPAVRVFDHAGDLVTEFHGEPMLPHPIAPGESVKIKIEYRAPQRAGSYKLKLDLVDQQVCWFEERGSQPLVIEFTVGTYRLY